MEELKSQTIEAFQKVRKRTEDLCKPLETEDFIPQPAEFVSPAKWHLAHTTWFFEQFILKDYDPDYREFHPQFGYLFNSYYNTHGQRVQRSDRGFMTRPTVKEVFAYRKHVDQSIFRFLEANPDHEAINELMMIGLNHEQQHQELLLTDLKYTLGNNPLFPVYREGFSLVSDQNQENGWLELDAGLVEIGFSGNGFSYDNEHNRHQLHLNDYGISRSLVTNAEFLEFMNDGGYERFELWLDEGWVWVNDNQLSHPLYWHKINGVWHQYTFAGLQKIDPQAMLAHISFYEAAAFAEWKGMRLPTEFEWEAASDQLNWGQRWEWTSSAYLPYPGFKKPKGAVGEYNGKFMINQMVLRGASNATALQHSRKTYRNFFHPHLQWQFAGIRLAYDR